MNNRSQLRPYAATTPIQRLPLLILALAAATLGCDGEAVYYPEHNTRVTVRPRQDINVAFGRDTNERLVRAGSEASDLLHLEAYTPSSGWTRLDIASVEPFMTIDPVQFVLVPDSDTWGNGVTSYKWSIDAHLPDRIWHRAPDTFGRSAKLRLNVREENGTLTAIPAITIDQLDCREDMQSSSPDCPTAETFTLRDRDSYIPNLRRGDASCPHGAPDCSRCVPDLVGQADAIFTGESEIVSASRVNLTNRIGIVSGDHIQGVARLPDREVNGVRKGRIVVSYNQGSGLALGYQNVSGDNPAWSHGAGVVDIDDIHFGVRTELNHPGGVQTHGDLIAIAMEQTGSATPAARVYFIQQTSDFESETVNTLLLDGSHGEPHQTEQSSAATAGFVKLAGGTYLVAVSGADHGTQGIWFYESSESEIRQRTTWNYVGFWEPPCIGYGNGCYAGSGGGLALLTDCSGTVYVLTMTGTSGFDSAKLGLNLSKEHDYLQVWEIVQGYGGRFPPALGSVNLGLRAESAASLGLIAKNAASFRWGGGAYVNEEGRLLISRIERGEPHFSGTHATLLTHAAKCPGVAAVCN